MKAARDDKNERFTMLYADYYVLVFNALYAKIGNENDVRDICQEVFLIMYQKLDEIQEPRRWLFGTLRNATLRFYEKNRKSADDIDRIFDDVAMTFVNGFRDMRIIINDAIEDAGLSDEERLILEYIAIYGYSYARTGEIMGLSKRQVGYKYLAAAKKILAELHRRGVEHVEDLL
jgi:RNA polymerase sigma factor (sigma-70 family)